MTNLRGRNMIDLKKSIYQNLKMVTSKVYDHQAPPNAVYPYLTTRYTTVSEDQESRVLRVTLEIDIWDNIRDTTRLEVLADDVDNAINRKLNNVYYYKVYRANPYRFELDNTDEKITRRQLRYLIHYIKN
jgi:hypothetical protein